VLRNIPFGSGSVGVVLEK